MGLCLHERVLSFRAGVSLKLLMSSELRSLEAYFSISISRKNKTWYVKWDFFSRNVATQRLLGHGGPQPDAAGHGRADCYKCQWRSWDLFPAQRSKQGKRKSCWVSWAVMTRQKHLGGLGFGDIGGTIIIEYKNLKVVCYPDSSILEAGLGTHPSQIW
jgi:hypothetical protein